ncbi:MAG: type II toxin-antitoxin system HicA family toxin [Peptococcaceae bacterium]|nr:type II toxin-antitoxin system HicA family toxin [Peptococcaceae bacterium]
MVRLPVVSDKEIIRVLLKLGFKFAPKRGKGSHIALFKVDEDGRKLVIVPRRKEIPRGTLLSILDQAHLTKEDFFKLLSQ